MSARRFLVVFDSLPLDVTSVRKGSNHPSVVTASRCVNVGLFVSGDLRRDVVVSFGTGPHNDFRVISFSGAVLKRVSPDERSVSLFLMKASQGMSDLERNESTRLQNGILMQRASMTSLLEEWDVPRTYISASGFGLKQAPIGENSEGLFIYEIPETSNIQTLLHDQVIPLDRPKTPERFILAVNLAADQTVSENRRKSS